MVLDAGMTMFTWVGPRVGNTGSGKTKMRNVGKKLDQYISNLTDRDPNGVSVVGVTVCEEPILFTNWFPEWEQEVSDKWKELDPH